MGLPCIDIFQETLGYFFYSVQVSLSQVPQVSPGFYHKCNESWSYIISVFQVKSTPGCYYCREKGLRDSETSRVHFLEEGSMLIPGEIVLIQVLQSSETVP